MSAQTAIKPAHKAIKAYYQRLEQFKDQGAKHEGAVSRAFESLLAETARVRKWTLIPLLSEHIPGRVIIPDGTLRDAFYIPRGYWEAKDTDDNLDQEIRKKIAKGYSTTNTIFEDTRTAVLYQDKQEVLRVDLANARQLADLLNAFYAHSEPNIDGFEKAVDEFKERVPELAQGLAKIIQGAHKTDKSFAKAFGEFFELCKASLNPNMSEAAVDEMLVQHLLTERLIRTIFNNEEFTKRNVIAVEVEKVIDTLVRKAFDRKEFLNSLDRFYVAIEEAGRTLTHFTEKQHFLNTVYERFFQGYSVEVADTHGIVYTPQPIVDFMCASVEEVLNDEFGLHLWSRGVNILDPCTGTGNFIVNLLRRIPKRDLPRAYREQLFANEVMLLPYYIAALNIEHAYYELAEEYEPFEGLCFVDTLDMVGQPQTELPFFAKKNTERVGRQARTPITVVIGNPPYNVGQLNENDNNKNRKYDTIDATIRSSYAKDSKATLNSKLYDVYVKFFRWATNRLGDREGIVCFVSNNSFVDQFAFAGMRKHLAQDFETIYHLDLHGNVRKNPRLSGTMHNVFGIQVGVGITLAVKRLSSSSSGIHYHRVPEDWTKNDKLSWLRTVKSLSGVEFRELNANSSNNWVTDGEQREFSHLTALAMESDASVDNDESLSLFATHSLGVSTNRDSVVYDFDKGTLCDKYSRFVDTYNAEVDRFKRRYGDKSVLEKINIDSFVDYGSVKWSSRLKDLLRRGIYLEQTPSSIRNALYRPFCAQYLYWDQRSIDRPGKFAAMLPQSRGEECNVLICVSGVSSSKPFQSLVAGNLVSLDMLEKTQCFPFFVFDLDGKHCRENITDRALRQFRDHYGKKNLGKWDIFYYVYGVLHHPGYRTKYSDNLKRELPRVPYAPDFRAFSKAGKELAKWHLEYEKIEPYDLKYIETPDTPLSYRVEDKMRLSKDKRSLVVNPSLTLSGIPAEAFEYRLGNRCALDWVIDQYQVTVDKRSGVRSDPNREDDPEYIVRLVGQVIRVSLETVRIVKGLPEQFEGK